MWFGHCYLVLSLTRLWLECIYSVCNVRIYVGRPQPWKSPEELLAGTNRFCLVYVHLARMSGCELLKKPVKPLNRRLFQEFYLVHCRLVCTKWCLKEIEPFIHHDFVKSIRMRSLWENGGTVLEEHRPVINTSLGRRRRQSRLTMWWQKSIILVHSPHAYHSAYYYCLSEDS